METKICGLTFKKVDDGTIAIFSSNGVFYKNINYPANTETEFLNSANFYYVHCY
jgi:hypothetical protein